jgi:AcrR family transcriptional regulator
VSRTSEALEPDATGGPVTRRERPYAGKSRLERRAERRRQLLDAGLALFGTRGYRRVTIEQLCSEAGVGIRAFYEEFGSRETFFRAVYDDVTSLALESIERGLEAFRDASSEVRLGACIRLVLESLLADSRRARVVSIESSALDEQMDRHRNDTMKRFAALLAGTLDDETRRTTGDPRLWSLMLGGGLNEAVISQLVSPDPRPIPDLAEALTRIWVRTIQR